jgi:dolichol-phosphate mannosyltransferase
VSESLIIIPTYNECENIEAIIEAVLKEVQGAHILVVDDGSPDGTGQLGRG